MTKRDWREGDDDEYILRMVDVLPLPAARTGPSSADWFFAHWFTHYMKRARTDNKLLRLDLNPLCCASFLDQLSMHISQVMNVTLVVSCTKDPRILGEFLEYLRENSDQQLKPK